jgi:hypothetical protein
VVLGPGIDTTPADPISNHDTEHDQEGEKERGRQRGSVGSTGQRPAVADHGQARMDQASPAWRAARHTATVAHGVTTRTDGACDVHDN